MSFVIGGVQFRAAEGVSTGKGTLFFGVMLFDSIL